MEHQVAKLLPDGVKNPNTIYVTMNDGIKELFDLRLPNYKSRYYSLVCTVGFGYAPIDRKLFLETIDGFVSDKIIYYTISPSQINIIYIS